MENRLEGGTSLTILCSAQMQDEQVGDAFVLGERQTKRWFGLAPRLAVAIDTLSVSINSISKAIDTIHVSIYSIRDVTCKDAEKSLR